MKNITNLFEIYKTKSAEKLIMLTIGIYLLKIRAKWVDADLLNLLVDISTLPKSLVLPVDDNNLSGRYFLKSRPLNGISYEDELKILNIGSIN